MVYPKRSRVSSVTRYIANPKRSRSSAATARVTRPRLSRVSDLTTCIVSTTNYQLVRQIAVGGMAEVYLARVTGVAGFCRYVAVKWLRPGLADDPALVSMLIDEALITSLLEHAGIPAIIDLGFCDGRYYIVEEYVHGRDLRHVLQRCSEIHGPPSVAIACYVVMKLCEALDYAHDATDGRGRPLQIIHRDISPPNVILSYEGAVKLIDFGIARACVRSTHTKVGRIKGKLSYMAPEQLHGRKLDRRSDVFAVGVLLYELLTTTPLFCGEHRAFGGEQQLLSRLRDLSVDDSLYWIISKALAWNPAFRYANAADLREALLAYTYRQGHYASRADLAHWLQGCFHDARDIHDPMALQPTQARVTSRRLHAWTSRPHTRILL